MAAVSEQVGQGAQTAQAGTLGGLSSPLSRSTEPQLYPIITGIFVASLLLANVTSQKIFAVGTFTFPGGAVIFPIAFIFGDILTETYGYARARRIIWTGFVCQIMAASTYTIVQVLPPASFWPHQAAYDSILGVVWRITLASMAAYFVGEFCNSYVLSKMKYLAEGRGATLTGFKRWFHQASRFVMSTVVGQAVDTAVFSVIAFAGIFGWKDLLWTSLSLYAFKVVYEVALTPVSVRFANWVKKVENVDQIDTPGNTRYTPFRLWD
ncbi:MAG TPA: queuosine precursor transporter [Phycisphaerales bacterium]